MRAFILALFALTPLIAQDWLSEGIRAYRSARYADAAEAFRKAVELNPNDVNTRLYFATALMSQYIPGAESPDNLNLARRAEDEFQAVLRLDPNNKTALHSLASLYYQQAQGMPDLEKKLRMLGEAAGWYERVVAVDPQDKQAYYSLGVIDWVNWYAAWMQARARLGMKPEDPGPLPDPVVRQQLKQQYAAVIEHGISNLEKALQIDPQYDDAMAYLNLFIRERADLRDTPEEYKRDVQAADEWVRRALETKKMRGVERVRVGGPVQQFKLIRKVDPVYPPLAKAARIQGTVRFTVIIDRDGGVQSAELVSGHPLLVEAAREAVSQWEYSPTLLDGRPVEVLTYVDVTFTLPVNESPAAATRPRA